MKASRLASIGLALGAFLVLLWLVGGNAYARHRERQVERAWVHSFGSLQDRVNRYPRTATNDAARRLEKLAEPLTLDLTPRKCDSLSADALSAAKQADQAWQAVSRYLTSQLEKSEASIDPPPKEVEDFFAAQGRDLRALAAELAASPVPRWDFDPSLLPSHQPTPNAHALLRLQRALLAEVLVESAGKNFDVAGQVLEASWKLNQTLRDVPDLVGQLLAVGIAWLQVGALRKVQVDASLWRARLAEHDFKRLVFDSELLALWPSGERYRRSEEIESRSERDLWKRVQTFFLRPCQEIVWSRDTEGMRLAYLRIKDSPLLDQEISERKSGPRSSAAEISIPIPNLLDAFRRVDRLVLDSELTAKILQARQLRLENDGKWPASIPGIEATRLLGARWLYSVSSEGVMRLALSQEPYKDKGGFQLPLCFTSS